MKVLALDTATEACSAALAIDDSIEERFAIAPRQHAKRLLADIEQLLTQHQLQLSQLDAIAFGRGPGSFTGVRIAASVCQGLAMAHDIPVAPISNLQALAYRARQLSNCKTALTCFDARMDQIYWALYDCDTFQPIIEEQVSDVSELQHCQTPDVIIGNGYRVEFESYFNDVSIIEDEFPHAADIAALAVQTKSFVSPEQALPQYLRDNVTHKKES